MSSLKIAVVTSEITPFSKTGGLADVTRSLSKAVKRLDQEVIVITPLYGQIIDKEKNRLKLILNKIKINFGDEQVEVNYWRSYLMEDLPIYFVENKQYFSKKKTLYGSSHDNARFYLFDVAVLELLKLLNFKPDILHCHDWHSGLIPSLIKNNGFKEWFKKTKTVYTIHNLAYQLGRGWWEVPTKKKDYGKKGLPKFFSPDLEYINFAKRAILSADIINTVSEQYREEIMTKNFGQDLHRILKNRENRLFGIVNGIDYNEFNPKTDKALVRNYDYKTCHRKKYNKLTLQKLLKLPQDEKIIILSFTSRVVFQKGFSILLKIIEPLLKLDLQIIILGDGDKEYIAQFKKIVKKYPKKIVWLPFIGNEKIETLIYAGGDLCLMPSYHEPCGINQLKAMRYGCLPVVRNVGGLSDTVTNYNPKTGRGNGFSFSSTSEFSFFGAIIRALENYRHPKVWQELVAQAMQESNSWEIPAKKYLNLYRKAMKL